MMLISEQIDLIDVEVETCHDEINKCVYLKIRIDTDEAVNHILKHELIKSIHLVYETEG